MFKGNDTTLAKVAADEPIFVLRAQDRLAPKVIREWATLAAQAGVSYDKYNEAEELAAEMEEWQRTHLSKLPD